jgi:hypothetical protein
MIAIEDILRDVNLTELERTVIMAFFNSFCEVFCRLNTNKYFDTVADILYTNVTEPCIVNRVGYNLLKDDFDNDFTVINPVNVDVEVIRASLKLVIICMTSDQFIYKRYDNMDILEDGMTTGKSIDEATASILDNTRRIN